MQQYSYKETSENQKESAFEQTFETEMFLSLLLQ